MKTQSLACVFSSCLFQTGGHAPKETCVVEDLINNYIQLFSVSILLRATRHIFIHTPVETISQAKICSVYDFTVFGVMSGDKTIQAKNIVTQQGEIHPGLI